MARNVDQNFEFKGVKNISKAAQLTEEAKEKICEK